MKTPHANRMLNYVSEGQVQSKCSLMAFYTLCIGCFVSPTVMCGVGLHSIAVEGFEDNIRASEHLYLVWNMLFALSIVSPVVLGAASIWQISRSKGLRRGIPMAVAGMVVPIGLLTFAVVMKYLL
jgi:hypothetical protein